MKSIPLSDFAQKHGQVRAAELLGITQGAVSKALRVGRQVYVQVNEDGTYTAEELRPFPSSKTAAA